MSKYKVMDGKISRMSEKHCGYTQMTTRSIQMALNGYENKLEKMTTLADNLAELFGEMHSELANWDPKAGEEYEKKFNEVMKR